MPVDEQTITALLKDYRNGDEHALDSLVPLVYEQLRQIARYQLAGKGGKTIAPTVLVHELFLRLKKSRWTEMQDRRVFFALASRCMRQLIIDFARKKSAGKRGKGQNHIALDEEVHQLSVEDTDWGALHEALERLSQLDERLGQVVELRYLIGLSIEETAEVMRLSPMTVKRSWTTARAWLQKELAA